MKLKLNRFLKASIIAAGIAVSSAGLARAQGTATGLSGLFFTSENGSGLRQTTGTDTHWSVTYASVAGAQNSTYQGAAYVITDTTPQGYVANTTRAGWITAPGAQTQTGGAGSANKGSDYLPGNGNSGTNEGIYVYTLAFQISGTGSGIVSNNISIALTIAADDQYQVYVNAAGTNAAGHANGLSGVNPANFTATQAGSGTAAWGNTASITLSNFGAGANSTFVIGTNYLTVVVDNTNSITTTSTQTDINPSGLLVYQTSNVITIGTSTVTATLPEVGTWLPVAGALGLLGWCRWRRRRSSDVSTAGS